MTFDSEDRCRRIALAKTTDQLTTIALEMANKPMDLTSMGDQESTIMEHDLSSAHLNSNTKK